MQTNTSANLIYTDSLQEYTISKNTFAIRPGFSYKISASALGKTAEGSTTIVKDTISFTEANWFSFGNSTNGNTPNGKFIYKWQDLTSVKNYYRVVTQLEEDMRFGDYTYNICDNMYDDASYDGKTMQSTCEDYTYRSDTSTVSIFLLNADKHYYEFMRRRLNYIYDDPFSEPTPQYNNVTGGLGVVCSYRFTLKKIKIY